MNNKRTKRNKQVKTASQANNHKNSLEAITLPTHVCKNGNKVVCNSIYHGDYIYIPSYLHCDLVDSDSFMTMENFPDEFYVSSESLFDDLINELKLQISEIKHFKNSFSFHTMEKLTRIQNWINLLKEKEKFFSGRELLGLDYCISTYASECSSNERKKEIMRTMFLSLEELKSHEIDNESFSKKIEALDNTELFEITEILLNSKIINHVIWDYQGISTIFTPNKRLEGLNKELSVYQLDKKSQKDLLAKPKKILWKDRYDSMPSKIINYIEKLPKVEKRIDEFKEAETYYTFLDDFNYLLNSSLVRFKSAKEFMDYKSKHCYKRILNYEDYDSNIRRLNAKALISDFVSYESIKVKNIAVGYNSKGIRFNEKTDNFSFKYYYSLVCPDNSIENFESIVFEKQNLDLIVYYYINYLHVFPIEIKEFEKTLSSFLLYAIIENIPDDLTDYENLINLKRELNAILKSKYIDIDDEFILIFLHFLNIDQELKQMRDESFNDFHEMLSLSQKE